MMCFIHYISATRRLTDIQKTITMLQSDKYSERDVPPMVLAQRDFIKKEREYFKDTCIEFLIVCVILLISLGMFWVLFGRFINVK